MASWASMITRYRKIVWLVNHWEDSFRQGEASFWTSENYTGQVDFERMASAVKI